MLLVTPPAAPRQSPAQPRLPLVAEALGYLGATMALVAGLIALRQFRPRIPAGAELALTGTAAVALLAAGLVILADRDPALARLRDAVWLLSAASLACFAGLLAGRQFWNLGAVSAPLVTEAAVAAYAVALWWRTRSALLHVAAFASVAALAGTAIALAWPAGPQWGAGAGIWAVAPRHRHLAGPAPAARAELAVGVPRGARRGTICGTGE